MLILRACWARNNSLTYGGKTPLECAYGRRPPDIINPENETFGSHAVRLSSTGQGPEGYHKSNVNKHSDFVNSDLKLQKIALEAHLQARQIYDMQRDFAAKLEYPTYTQIKENDPVWYWSRDPNKIRHGKWVHGRVTSSNNDRSHISIRRTDNGQEFSVTRTKLRLCADPWHDVVIPDDSDDEYLSVETGPTPESSRQPNEGSVDEEQKDTVPSSQQIG